jgi:hypothetical protein
MVRKIKIGIIGAGPSAIAAAIPFLKEKNKFEVNMISSGESLFTEEVINLQNYLKSLDRDSQHKYWENKEYTSKELIPKKLFFGKTKVYNDVEDDLEVSKKINFDVSHSIGGLSNVWGANVTGLSKNDLENYYYLNNLGEQLSKITSIFPISGFKDDIDLDTPYNLNYNKIALKYSSQAHTIIDYYNQNKNFFKKNNFRFGYAKLAIQTSSEIEKNNCDNSGLEMFGCNQNSIFNSTFFINKISKDLNLFQNTIVENIEHKNNKIFLICKNEGKKFDVEFDKLIITAGTINTTKLVLKLFSSRKKKSLIIKDSRKYFFLYFTLFKSKKNEEKNTIGLSQIFMQTEIGKHTIHLQLYHSVLLLKKTIINLTNKSIGKFIIKYFDFILKRLMIGVVYFPEEISHHMKMEYKINEKKFSLNEFKNKNFSFKYIISIYIRLTKFFLKLKSIPLPIFVKTKIGGSQHFGASLPMSSQPTDGQTNLNGELYGFKNIYISDSSSLSRIPSTPPTFMAMSNAYRISSKIVTNINNP